MSKVKTSILYFLSKGFLTEDDLIKEVYPDYEKFPRKKGGRAKAISDQLYKLVLSGAVKKYFTNGRTRYKLNP